MSLNLPNIDVIFSKLASTLEGRSQKENVILIIKDDTDKTFSTKVYTDATVAAKDSALYTPANLMYITDAFIGEPAKVTVIRIDATGGKIADALTIAGTLERGWIGTPSEVQADQDAITSFIKDQVAKKRYYFGIVFNSTVPPNFKFVTNIDNPKVTFKGSRGEQTSNEAIPTLLGYFAGNAITRSATNLVIENLVSVQENTDVNADINNGKMPLINDNDDGENKVRIGLAINSLTDDDAIEDEKFIEIVEAEALIATDVRNTFKNDWQGKVKNTPDHQVLFVSAVNGFYKELTKEENGGILDENFDNASYIDTDVQKKALVAAGVSGASSFTDAQVKQTVIGRKVFLKSNIKILFAMTDLTLNNMLN
ncbi:phage tail sheath C-terminal domain-containing protein [Clostridium sp. AWRP]|uniref:phage tail sheath C-terminal domain-containing protein n=1 Tax=Clostridium sp. AWRP TaxID=2212991 RepID=UPI000FD8B68E|nr:phage tail sheath C-terminal domain-containing protein [Clostridium sp. AWRP]AZV56798.1 phage tail sheath protein [Clostridium sp. AWRP]